MTGDKLRSIALAALMVLSVVAMAAPAGAATNTTVSVDPGSQSVDTGNTVQYDIVVDSVDNGIASYEFEASVGNVDTAKITDVSLQGTQASDTLTTVDYADDNSSVSVAAGVADHDNGVIATITVEGVAEGETDLTLSGVAVGDNDANSYTIDGTNSGTVSVQADTGNGDNGAETGITTGASEYTDKYTSGERYWIGQSLLINDDDEAGTTLELYTVTRESGGEYFVDQYRGDVPLNESGEEVLDTSDLNPDERYVITTGNANEVVMADNGNVTNYASPTSDNIRQASFTLTQQTLSVSWDDASTYNDGDEERYMNELEITSNRGSYTVWLTAPGLDTDDFEEIFGDQVQYTFSSSGTDYVALEGTTDVTYDANFDGIDAGEYEFTAIVSDTFDSDTATVQINELDLDFQLTPDVIEQEAGDWAEIAIDVDGTDEAYVIVGGPEVNYLTRVHVQDADDDGTIEFSMNTALAGATADPMDVFETRYSDDDILDADRPRPGAFGNEDSTFFIPDQVEPGLDDRAFIDPADYTVTISRNAQIEESGGELVLPGEETAGVMILDPGQTEALNTYVVPSGESVREVEDIEENAVETDYVARGDFLVAEMKATGISGFIDERADFLGDEVPEIVFSFTGSEKVNEEAPGFSQGNLIQDPQNDTYYIVFNTGDLSAAQYPAEEYGATLVIEPPLRAGDQLNYDADGDGTNDLELTTTSVDLEEPTASVDDAVDDELNLQASENVTLTGTSNVAPGSEITIQIRSEDNILRERATVSEDGEWEVTFADFAENFPEETEFELTVRRAGRSLRTIDDGMVVTPANIQITNFNAPSSVLEQRAVTVSATIENTGGQSVTDTVEWVVAGDTVKSQEITVGANDSVDVEFTISTEGLSAGDYEHSLVFGDASQSATLTIEAETTPTEEPTATPTEEPTATPTEEPTATPTETEEPETTTESDGGDGPGFGIAVALVALLAAALLAVRRQD